MTIKKSVWRKRLAAAKENTDEANDSSQRRINFVKQLFSEAAFKRLRKT